MNILDIIRKGASKTGHGIKVVATDTAKAAPEVAEVAAEVATIAVPGVGTVAGAIGDLLHVALPKSTPVAKAVSGLFQTSIQGDSMNQLEAFAITMVLGILQSTVKNPAHKAALQSQLIGVADDIYAAYGMNVPVPTATPEPVSH